MNPRALTAALTLVFLASCSGNFGSGPSQPNTVLPPPGVGAPVPGPTASGIAPQSVNAQGGGDTATVPITQTAAGLPCPTVNGYTCTLRFNIPPPTPTPQPTATPTPKRATHTSGKPHGKPTPSPTPSPTVSPTVAPSASTSPSALVSPGASPSASPAVSLGNLTLHLEALPKDAPALVHLPSGAVNATALVMVHLSPSADLVLDGDAVAAFTLPQGQIGSRGFVVQLFEETTHHKRHDYRALYTWNKSTLDKETLSFAFSIPKLTVPKGSSYAIVLYGSDEPSASASPSASPSSVASAAPSSAPSAMPSAAPTGRP